MESVSPLKIKNYLRLSSGWGINQGADVGRGHKGELETANVEVNSWLHHEDEKREEVGHTKGKLPDI